MVGCECAIGPSGSEFAAAGVKIYITYNFFSQMQAPTEKKRFYPCAFSALSARGRSRADRTRYLRTYIRLFSGSPSPWTMQRYSQPYFSYSPT